MHLALGDWFLGEALVQQGPHPGGLASLPMCACRGRVTSAKAEMTRQIGVYTMPSCDVLVSSASLYIIRKDRHPSTTSRTHHHKVVLPQSPILHCMLSFGHLHLRADTKIRQAFGPWRVRSSRLVLVVVNNQFIFEWRSPGPGPAKLAGLTSRLSRADRCQAILRRS